MKRIKKTKDQRIREAVEELNKAMIMKDPDIRINLHSGVYDNDRGKKFGRDIKTFVQAYKEYYGLEKVKLELFL